MAHTVEPSLPRVLRQSRNPSPAEVAARARLLWELYGRPAGRDEWIWLEAERQLNGLDVRRVAVQQAGDARPGSRPLPGRVATVREL